MKKNIAILGSTGSIGMTTLTVIKNNANKFDVKLLTAKNDVNKIFNQAIKFKVKNVVIEDKVKYNKYKNIFRKKKINLFLGIKNLNKILKKTKLNYCVNGISGLSGLEPTLNIIPFTKNLLIANKESIVCGWPIINKQLIKYKTNFIPIDSEHFSIWKLIKYEKPQNIKKVILTASGGPFLNKSKNKIANIKPKFALNHPNWKMGKKISIDSSTMMNKIFEFIEAKKIFNLKNEDISIMIHPLSFIHAIVFFKGNLVKLLAHEANMNIPISNSLGIHSDYKGKTFKNLFTKLNKLKFTQPKEKDFPLLSIIKYIPEKTSYFETILTTLNDELVKKYLDGNINYISLIKNIIYFIKSPYFKKYYKLKPKNIYDINKITEITKKYLFLNVKHYEK